MRLKTIQKFKSTPPLLIALLWLGLTANACAADEGGLERLARPSDWVARGFVPPTGDPECIDGASAALNPEALRRLCEAARNGDAKAQHNLGQLFFQTKGAEEQDFDGAYQWLHLAAEQGLPEAQYGLGLLHAYSLGFVGNDDEALKWFTRAANGGHANAQYWLGLHHATTLRGSGKHMDKALGWLRQSAQQGNPLAMEVLTNTTKRMAQSPPPAPSSEGEYTLDISLAACSADFDINQQRSAPQGNQAVSQSGEIQKNANVYVYYTRADLLRGIAASPETYLGMMGTCFGGIASRAGPGFVKIRP